MNATNPDIKPPRLQRGDTIGIIAPAGPIRDTEEFTAGIRLIKEMGFQTKLDRDVHRQEGYLAGTDQRRIEEFNSMWADPEVKAVFTARGGYGSLRIAAGIDMDLVRNQPKILVGFSDITILLGAIVKATGITTFHGPTVSTLTTITPESVTNLFTTITGVEPPPPIKPDNLEILISGDAEGQITGGNLTNLTHTLATPFEPDWRNNIVFLEDVGESPYRIDRMLTHLAMAGKLDNIAGLILGSFTDCGDNDLIWERVLELVGDNIPVWGNFPAGHGNNNMTLPFGSKVKMDSVSGKLQFTSPCTSNPD